VSEVASESSESSAQRHFVRRSDFLPFARPTIDEEDVEEVVDVLRSGWLTSGPRIQKFEQEFSAEVGGSARWRCRRAARSSRHR
jgi:dTDP-4-amino-4,6-dideoxygalactose transaminase